MAVPNQAPFPDPPPAPPPRRYSLFHPPLLAFFSKALYRDVAWRWPGTGLLYLFLLVAVSLLPTIVMMQVGLSGFVDTSAKELVDQIPEITIRDGKVSIDEPQPYVIENKETGEPVAIIDTTGETTSLDDTKAHVLLTETTVIIRKDARETRIVDLADVREFTLNGQRVHGWLLALKRWLVVVLCPLMLGSAYVYRVVQALLYALFGLVIANIFRITLSYTALLRLSIIAVTPVIVLDTILGATGTQFPGWWPLCFLIAMGYLFFGVKAAAEPQPRDPGAQPPLTAPYPGPPTV